MAAKRNATGLQMASDLQRKTLNDDELVSVNIIDYDSFQKYNNNFLFFIKKKKKETTCLQENLASLDLPYFEYNASQFPSMVGYFANVLLRM